MGRLLEQLFEIMSDKKLNLTEEEQRVLIRYFGPAAISEELNEAWRSCISPHKYDASELNNYLADNRYLKKLKDKKYMKEVENQLKIEGIKR